VCLGRAPRGRGSRPWPLRSATYPDPFHACQSLALHAGNPSSEDLWAVPDGAIDKSAMSLVIL